MVFEQQDGNRHLMAGMTAIPAKTTGKWAAAVAPIVEWNTQTRWQARKEKNWKAAARQRTKRKKLDTRNLIEQPDKRKQSGFCENYGRAAERRSRLCKESLAGNLK